MEDNKNKLDDSFLDDITGGMSQMSMDLLRRKLDRGVGGGFGSGDSEGTGSSLVPVECPVCMRRLNVKDVKNYTCMLCGAVVGDGGGTAL